jgi:hypothetical protein
MLNLKDNKRLHKWKGSSLIQTDIICNSYHRVHTFSFASRASAAAFIFATESASPLLKKYILQNQHLHS